VRLQSVDAEGRRRLSRGSGQPPALRASNEREP
jgi:hypothetical protein